MKKDKTVLIVAVTALLLLLSWQTYSMTHKLQEELRVMRSEVNNLSHRLSQEVSGVHATFREIREESRWWSPAGVSYENVGTEEAVVKVSWQMKDYQAGSSIMFYYRERGQDAFREIVGEEESSGYFSVLLNVDLPLEPQWDMHIARERNSRESETIVEETKEDHYTLSYEYYITSEYNDTIRTGEIQNLYLGDLVHSVFNPLYTRVHMRGDGNFFIHLDELKTGQARYSIREARLELRQGSRVLERWPLESQTVESGDSWEIPEDGAFYILNISEEIPSGPRDSYYLVVEYTEGIKAEKKIQLH